MDSLAASRSAGSKAAAPDWKAYAMAPSLLAKKMSAGWTQLRLENAGAVPWVWLMTFGLGLNPLAALVSLVRFVYDYLLGIAPLNASGAVMQPFMLLALHLPLMALSGGIPLLAIGYGSLMVFFPSVRRRRLENSYELRPWEPLGPVQIAIYAFARRLMPDVVFTANLKHSHLLAFVYPGSATEARLAVFGGLLLLWQRDREAAQSVIAHELAHFRRGEALHLGAGSGLETALKAGIFSMAGALVFWLLLGLLNWKLTGILLSSALGAFGIYAVLLAAFWCSEFQADRLAAEELGSSDGLLRALEQQQERGSSLSRLLARLTHPPLSWRRAMLQRGASHALLLSNLIFLGGLSLRSLLLAFSLAGGYFFLGRETAQSIGAAMPYGNVIRDIAFSGTGFMVAGMGFFIWPLLHYRWATLWSRQPVQTRRAPLWPWGLSILISTVLGIFSMLLTAFCYFELLGAPSEDPAVKAQREREREELLRGITEQNNRMLEYWNSEPGQGILNFDPESLQAPAGTEGEAAPQDWNFSDGQSGGADSTDQSVWDSFENLEPQSQSGDSSGGY
ncbi:M48 family metalloprotease [bacterium]|nr:M48 family metalloprotease [bacterium]